MTRKVHYKSADDEKNRNPDLANMPDIHRWINTPANVKGQMCHQNQSSGEKS
jgi:hypothetical protein